MSSAENAQNSLKRNLSYNDLKKRRMTRSTTIKGKLQAMANETKIKNIENQLICTHGSNKNSIKLEALHSYGNGNKENQSSRQINLLRFTDGFVSENEGQKGFNIQKCPSNARMLPKLDTVEIQKVGMKKTKSTRILTKKALATCIAERLNPKPHQNPQCNAKIKQKQESKLVLQQYKSAPEDLRPSLTENSLFNSLSPIQKKGLSSKQKQGEISGLSLLYEIEHMDIEEKEKIKKKTETKEVSDFNCEAHCGETDARMPRIMKRYLPKDFFLRV